MRHSLPGDAPWVMLYANTKTGGKLPEHYANVGFIVEIFGRSRGVVVTTAH